MIHPTAIINPAARIDEGVEIGPYCVIDGDVEIKRGTVLMSHVVVGDGARIGADVRIHPNAVIATAPQDLKYLGEPTLAIIGDRTTIRECVTINRGTVSSGKAQVGSDCLLMAYVHVAHDCVVGDHVIMANSVQLGGRRGGGLGNRWWSHRRAPILSYRCTFHDRCVLPRCERCVAIYLMWQGATGGRKHQCCWSQASWVYPCDDRSYR